MRGTRFGALVVVLSLPLSALACTNDRNTERDERDVRQLLRVKGDSTFNLISGQFPHHGEAFWRAQRRESEQYLGENPDHAPTRNDLAVALIKLGKYELALTQLDRIDALVPDRYETHSNRGVLYKKMGRYDDAARSIARAMEIKPGGHMNLGDYYLKMCRWRAQLAKTHAPPSHNFLGQPYSHLATKGDRAYLETLIQNDRGFADAYMVLGDRLVHRGDPSNLILALWAYARADHLEHPAPQVVEARFARAHELLARHIDSETTVLLSPVEIRARMLEQLELAQDWVVAFEETEAGLVETMELGRVDFRRVEGAMTHRRIDSDTIELHVHRSASRTSAPKVVGWIALGSGLLGLLILVWNRRRRERQQRSIVPWSRAVSELKPPAPDYCKS